MHINNIYVSNSLDAMQQHHDDYDAEYHNFYSIFVEEM